MILDIVQYPDPFLFKPSKPVDKVDEGIQRTVRDMFETLYAQENCAGLAAPQLGIPWRMTVIDFSEEKNKPLCMINPQIESHSTETVLDEEGCMSIPVVTGKVKRYAEITVRFLNEQGEAMRMENVSGFMARVMQHEIDHLDGILFLDRLSATRKAMALQKLAKLRKKT